MRLFLSADDRRAILGDLQELYERQQIEKGDRFAANWYRRQTLQYPFRLLAERLRYFTRRRGGDVQPKSREPRRSEELMHNTVSDIRLSARSLIRSPLLAATIVLTVGLGIGGTVAVFAVIHAVLLEPLPYDDSGQLVRIYHDYPPHRWTLSVADFLAIEEQQTSFDGVAAYFNRRRTYNRDDRADAVRAKYVTAGYFSVLRVSPLHGRTFSQEDGAPGAEPTVVLSHAFWRTHLGGEQSAIGSAIRLNGIDHTVIGVLPSELGPLEDRDVFPIAQLAPPERRGPFFLTILGRLRPAVEAAAARQELHAINRRIFPIWQSTYPDPTPTYGMMPLHEFVVGDVGTRLTLLFASVGFLLLIASSNAANLLVTRASHRRREVAVRAALGASRGRLVRYLVTEALLLASAGAALGLGLAFAAAKVLTNVGPDLIPRAPEIAVNGPVLWFAAAVTLGSALLFGFVPSVQASGSKIEEALRGSRGGTEGAATQRFRRVLVTLQFAVAVPLLIGAGLLLNSFAKLQRVDPGVDTENVLTVSISLPRASYPDVDSVIAFWDQITARIRALAGVIEVGQGTGKPVWGAGIVNNINLEDKPTPPDQTQPTVPWPIVTPEYFAALRIPLIRGRMFDERDRLDSPFVALVDQAWVRRFFPGEDPIGKRFREGGCETPDCPWVTVIGVVGDVKYAGLDDPGEEGTIYTPLSIWPAVSFTPKVSSYRYLFVRTAADPVSLMPMVRDVVRAVDPALVLAEMATMDQVIRDTLDSPRNFLALVGAFAAVALLLAAIGIYGVMAYFVQQRSREMAIRIALGGGPTKVLGLVVRQGMLLALAGVAVGVGGALLLTRFMSSVLFEVAATDPSTFVAVSLAVAATALAACFVPARRAARLNPAVLLREE
jgi:putative ABC transport system permease protein